MHWLVEIGLSNAVAAVALAVVAWGVGSACRRPAVTHALWLLVLLKLLTPPIIELPLPLPIAHTPPAPPVTVPDTAADTQRERFASEPEELSLDRMFAAQSHVALVSPLSNRALAESFPTVVDSAPSTVVAASPSNSTLDEGDRHLTSALASPRIESHRPHTNSWARWGQLAVFAWLFGLGVWIVLQLVLGLRLYATLRASAPAPRQLRAAAERIARCMGLKRCPQVRIVPGAGAPMLCGLGRGTSIFMPAGLLQRLDREAQATVLAHELAHYRRGDPWVRLVELVATGLFWWHPVVWWARHRIEIAEEQCCDAHVLSICSGKARVYAEALLDIVDLISEPARRMRPVLSSGIGHRPLLARRLVDVMNGQCVPTIPPLARRVIVIGGAVCLFHHPTFFVTEAPTLRAATSDAGRDTMRRRLQSLPLQLPSRQSVLPGASEPAATRTSPKIISVPEKKAAVEDAPWATAISPNGRYHVSVSRGYKCELREVTRNRVHSLTGHRITCVAFTADSANFVSGDLGGTVRLWDAASGKVLDTLTQRDGAVHSVSLAPAGDYVAVAGADGIVELVSFTRARDRQVLARISAPIRCVRFSPSGSTLCVVTDTWRRSTSTTVTLYDVATQVRLLQWKVHAPLGAADFPAEDRLLTVDWSGRVRAWSLPLLDAVDLPAVAKESVSAASFSADSRVLEHDP